MPGKRRPEYTLTAHARDMLTRRNIEDAWVQRVFHAPDAIEPDPLDAALEHRLGRVPEHEGRMLRLVVNVTAIPPRIVTAFFDRRRSTS